MTDENRDALGRVVREAWVRWARTQPEPKPSWLVSYDELSEADKEADRQIAEAVLSDLNCRRIFLVEKKHAGGLSEAEATEFAALQEGFFAALEVKHPRPTADIDRQMERLDVLERRLSGQSDPKEAQQ
jgi:hypothetical protein